MSKPRISSGTGTPTRDTLGSMISSAPKDSAVGLDVVRETLRLSVAETAQLFGVTPRTIYSWHSGSAACPEHAERLREIVQALGLYKDIITSEGGRVAHRAIEGRTTLLQLLTQGVNAQDAICRLGDILIREAAQRERMASRLKGRTGNWGEADVDTLG